MCFAEDMYSLFVLSFTSNFSALCDKVANLDLCLALTAISCEDSYVPHLSMRHWTSVSKVISKSPVILTTEFCAVGEGASIT
jgi:hypothetical protein